MRLLEGGNVFKDELGRPLTRRINQNEVMPTVKWLEQLTGLDLTSDLADDGLPAKWLGSTGRKSSSGDLDLAVDAREINKETLEGILQKYAEQIKQDPGSVVKKFGISVHFKAPINGDPDNGYVQSDFMFGKNPLWMQFMLSNDPNSNYRGEHRNIMLSSLAKASGYKINQSDGMVDRVTGKLVTDDPERIARMLLNPNASRRDLRSVEHITRALKMDPKRGEKLHDFIDYMNRSGVQYDPDLLESESNFLARLRDRVVNQGMAVIIEQPKIDEEIIAEAEEAGVGGKAKGIEHLEDLVFRLGKAGISQAIEIVHGAAKNPKETTTVKWDGKPAVIFGRKPATGEFVLTDGSGFDAKGYDGLATSPEMMAQIQSMRKGDRAQLIEIYRRLFPVLDAALPKDFRGYVKGDLLYMSQPEIVNNKFEFRPNEVTYRIPVQSNLGKAISKSNIGVAMHTMYADQGAARQPLQGIQFQPVPGLLLIEPHFSQPQAIKPNPRHIAALQDILNKHGSQIDSLFHPTTMREFRIADLAKLFVSFVNSKVGQNLNPANILHDLGVYLKHTVSENKYRNIIAYLEDPNRKIGLRAVFRAFLLLHEIKEDIRAQLDMQHPGQEGWVMATPSGYAKAVGRFNPEAFAARNRARNNPRT